MKKILLLILPFALFASEPSGNGYDIVPRVLNFLLFAGILYYFAANPIKNAYRDRINNIAFRLDSVQQKLKESRRKKDDMLAKVQETKLQAASLVETAKKEADLISEKIRNEAKQEILNLEKSFQDQKEFEQRRVTKSVVTQIINDIFADGNSKVDQNELVNIVLKKVG